jgi:hypothetical protein
MLEETEEYIDEESGWGRYFVSHGRSVAGSAGRRGDDSDGGRDMFVKVYSRRETVSSGV